LIPEIDVIQGILAGFVQNQGDALQLRADRDDREGLRRIL
jgi:hypothetical protein